MPSAGLAPRRVMSKAAALSMASLEHPLPAGMRDLLPEEAAARRAVARAFLGHAELFGYEQVIPPVFEYAHTIERGLGTLDPREIVRFVEPETGEVVALRPDVTPQIARLVATRLPHMTPPYRLAYDATVLRRRVAPARARTHRQIAQLGVELIGVALARGRPRAARARRHARSTRWACRASPSTSATPTITSLLAGLEPARRRGPRRRARQEGPRRSSPPRRRTPHRRRARRALRPARRALAARRAAGRAPLLARRGGDRRAPAARLAARQGARGRARRLPDRRPRRGARARLLHRPVLPGARGGPGRARRRRRPLRPAPRAVLG